MLIYEIKSVIIDIKLKETRPETTETKIIMSIRKKKKNVQRFIIVKFNKCKKV